MNGSLMLRIRLDSEAYIENNIEKPYEIHIGTFESKSDFQNFIQDE